MDRDSIYIAALLHDIGKFIERSKSFIVNDRFKHIKVGHPKYSAQLLFVMQSKSKFFKKYGSEIIDLVLYHHEPRNDYEKIIQLADWLSSSEREEGETKEKYYTVPMMSIFSRLFDEDINMGYKLAPLSTSEGFPEKNPTVSIDTYKKLVNSFLNELGLVSEEKQLYYLMEKYLWCVPAQTTNYIPDISLFDHGKTTAAIALCLYDEYKAGRLNSEDLKKMKNNTDKHFMLIKGDISGIQDFIFSIPSKGAAKSLKGHSVYLSLLTDVIARYLIDKMDLKAANILYNGGGNFYILAPKLCEDSFIKARKNISEKLLKAHNGLLYLVLERVLISPADFMEFNKKWDEVKEKVNFRKYKKWEEIGLEENYNNIFGPSGNGSQDNNHCYLCGIEEYERRLDYISEIDKQLCSFCKSYMELTDSVRNADTLVIKIISGGYKNSYEDYRDVFRAFGYDYNFVKKEKLKDNEKQGAYLLNNTEFLQEGFSGYRLGAYKLPFNNNLEEKKQYDFDEIANMSIGDPKLAVLKLDVDNLGSLFFRGLGEKSTISRITSISRMLTLYFEGYINQLIAERKWENYLYVVFSGGDDTFIIGSWDKVLDFTDVFYKKFREYTCYNPHITFSAGVCIFRYDFPVIMSSRLTEEALEMAKNYIRAGEKVPSKNKITLFGEVFTWEEFNAIRNLKKLLLEIIEKNSHKDDGESFGRTFLYKVWKSTLGFKKILQDSVKGRVDKIRFWRLAYYLREIAKEDAELLIAEYRRIVIDNLLGKSTDEKIKNIMVIPAAVKCAQMETRKMRR